MTGERIDPERPTGEEMLARAEEPRPDGRGRLRVYLGMAPGVGKTYKMLEEAHRRLERGTDVAIGFVEAHGRARTVALLDGLETIARLHVEYRGVVVEDLDAEAVIARRPAVAIVDELAHTNVPGSPREKRWQDVELIRDAGIHVLSTCNVQHIESVADAVETIVGARVRERLPDAVLAEADEVELVDMSPHALRQRIRHGNVYPPERARVALERFFTESNLTALRDLSLRFVAGQVDEQLEETTGERGLDRIVAVTERVMAVVDDSEECRRALRRAASLASALRAPFLALVLETPAIDRLSIDRARVVAENSDHARDLGAEIVRMSAADELAGIEAMARRRRVTHLVLVAERRGTVDRLRRASMADELLARVPGLEVHLIGRVPLSGYDDRQAP
ncbi:MAG: sensor histidine kinase KdpD [Candidatus Limnocylindrales bacterium]